MIRYLKHDDIDKQKWDGCIADSTNALVYAYSWYLDIVSPRWDALVDDGYQAVMPLTWKSRFGMRYLCQPFFTQKLGVFSKNEMSDNLLAAFLDKTKSLFLFAEINLNASNVLKDSRQHDNYELSLAADYGQLAANYHENTRRNLLKAAKGNLVTVDDVGVEKLISLFDTDRRKSLPSFNEDSYDVLRALSVEALRRGSAFIKGVAHEGGGDVVAAAMFLSDSKKLTFLFSGNSIEGKQSQAMAFLVDSVVRQYCGSGLILDFEGSDDEGLARFYKGFGSELVRYNSLNFNNMSWLSSQVLRLWKKLKS